uniref:Autophagy protein 5 n=1 Tax=Anopheles farauti TaxID=69004 RepID=A0A182Q286_9DIPT
MSNELQDGEMWMDSNGTPLKWHFPIGVLYDLLVGTDGTLPWHVTVHFSKFPDDILIRCPNREIVEAHFMSSLKEADVLKHRGQVVSAMQKKDHNQLWLGLVNGNDCDKPKLLQVCTNALIFIILDKFDQFWAVNRRLMEPIPDQDGFKHIPVRCYVEDGTYQQKLVAPSTATGQKRILQDLLDDFSTPVRKAVSKKAFLPTTESFYRLVHILIALMSLLGLSTHMHNLAEMKMDGSQLGSQVI